jgi:hypothetical protein
LLTHTHTHTHTQTIPCSNWPGCRFEDKCIYAHPSEEELQELRKRGTEPLTLSDLLPLIVPFKNSTNVLQQITIMMNRRLAYAYEAKFGKKPPPIGKAKFYDGQPCAVGVPPAPLTLTTDDVLRTLGLPLLKDIDSMLSQSQG